MHQNVHAPQKTSHTVNGSNVCEFHNDIHQNHHHREIFMRVTNLNEKNALKCTHINTENAKKKQN